MLKNDLIAQLVMKELLYKPSLLSQLADKPKKYPFYKRIYLKIKSKWYWAKDVYHYAKHGCDC